MADETALITEVAGRGIVRLQSWATGEPVHPALVPPGLGGQVRILALSPYEWFAVSDTLDGPQLHERLRHYTADQDIAAVDLTCGVKVLRIQGVGVRELLSQGCGLDLHPTAFPAGRTTRTRFAQLSVVIDCFDPTPRFDLYVNRSSITYLRDWMQDVILSAEPTASSRG